MLLLTVPHAKREASGDHDEGAMRMIPHLRVALDNAGIDYEVLVGDDTYRSILDLNRGESRHTEFAKELRVLLKKATYHIDLHSFPDTPQDASDDVSITAMGDDIRNWSVSDVVFLSIPNITDPVFLEEMKMGLEKTIVIDDIQTDDYNYVTVFAQVAMDVPSVLIELNEGSVQSYPAVATEIARTVGRLLDSVVS